MKKLLLIISLLLATVQGMAVSIEYASQSGSGPTPPTPTPTEPTRTLLHTKSGISVSYNINTVSFMEDDVFTDAYNVIISGFENTNEEANPAYPFKAERFELPEGCENVAITVTDFRYRERDITLAPARILIADSQDYTFTPSNIKKIGNTDISSGNEIVTYTKVVEKSGKKYVEVGLQPMQYNSSNKTMRLYYDFTYRIDYLDSSGNQVDIMGIEDDSSTLSLKFSYLILSSPEFSDVCEEFAKKKRLHGFTTSVVLSENWTPSSVKETIKEYRRNPIDNLKFVLLVGGNKIIPSNVVYTTAGLESGTISLSDYYYGCLDSDDDFEQDVYIGRIPANNAAEAEVAIDKIIQYEFNPIVDSDFYNNSLHCAHYQVTNDNSCTSRYFVWTSEKIYDHVYDYGYDIARVYKKDNGAEPNKTKNLFTDKIELIHSELRAEDFNWNGTTQDIIDNINRGVFYVLHRDHGSFYGWGSPSFPLTAISKLNNGDKLPVVFSINCQTGDFSKQCFASKFLLHENGGCSGIFAATNLTYSSVNDYLALAMFNSVWRSSWLVNPVMNQHGFMRLKSVYSLGEILDEGMEYVCSKYGSDNPYYKVTRERFHIFGDPSMMIHTKQPISYDKHTADIQKI